jgi:Family of unknown function (DUF5329)
VGLCVGLFLAVIAASMRLKIHFQILLSLTIASGLSCSTLALGVELDSAGAAEIEQLLARLGASGCRFQRNESWYTAQEARAHLEKKYRYLLGKQLVGSAEDFVFLGATKSSTSGKPYLVQCRGQQSMPSATWMATQRLEMRESIKYRDQPKVR